MWSFQEPAICLSDGIWNFEFILDYMNGKKERNYSSSKYWDWYTWIVIDGTVALSILAVYSVDRFV